MVSPAVVISHFAPSPFSEHLHHDILRVNKGLEVGKLSVFIVPWFVVVDLLSCVENLHSHNSKDKEANCKDQKKSCYYRKYLSKSLKEALQLLQHLRITLAYYFAEHECPEEKGHSEDSADFEEVVDVIVGADKEKDDVENDEKGIYVVPSIREVSLRTNGHQSYQQL